MILFHASINHGVNTNLDNAQRKNKRFSDITLNHERFDEKSYKT